MRRWALPWVLLVTPAFAAFTGAVQDEQGGPIAAVYVGLFTDDWTSVAQGLTEPDGSFSLPAETAPASGHLVVQPPAAGAVDGIEGYAYQPRVFKYAGESNPTLTLPDTACLVLRAYDRNGEIIRWEAFRDRGMHGDQFVYATDLQMDMAPAVVWPVYDETARQGGSVREQGLPAIAVAPGETCAVQVLYWETRGYGKLWLRADNAGQGYTPAEAGETRVLDLNVELARTAVADLYRRSDAFPALRRLDIGAMGAAMDAVMAMDDPVARAAKADELLVAALRLRDELELETARRNAPTLRDGTIELTVTDGDGNPVPNSEIILELRGRAFHFGVFEGGQFQPSIFETARDAGFDLSTLLLGWGWLMSVDAAGIEKTYGIQRQLDMGFTLKAHGVIWLQEYGILPSHALTMPHDELAAAAINFQQRMLESYFEDIAIWESMNEPPATNAVGMARDRVTALLADATESIEYKPELVSLVNAAHEINFGQKYGLFNIDGTPADAFPMTYSAYLDQAMQEGALEQIDVVALQIYPGFRFGDRFHGLQGPCVTPSWIVDAAKRYSRYGKPVHISEFSLPNQYGDEAKNGYWRETWSPGAQAEYAEAAFAIAYGNPHIESITWWDLTDGDSSVVGGGLMSANGEPKPVMTRLAAFLNDVSPNAIPVTTDANGNATIACAAGTYAVAGTDRTITVQPRQTIELAVEMAP